LTATAYKYLDIDIRGVGLLSFVEMLLGGNKAIRLYCLMQREKHSLQNVLILRNLYNQSHLHHCQFKIWL